MIVEGIKLTPLLIKSIKTCQENPDILNYQLETFDKVIYLLAIYGENGEPNDAASIIRLYLIFATSKLYSRDWVGKMKISRL